MSVIRGLLLIGLALFPAVGPLWARQGPTRDKPSALKYLTETNIPYRTGANLDEYTLERCRLDVYYPEGARNFPTVVWFHGGGLTGGNRSVPAELKGKGIAVVAVNYRLSPKVTAPAYIEDAAAAVAWTFKNIGRYNGSTEKIFVSGHSAGGYLAAMIGLDKKYLAKEGIDANKIAGLIPLSGQAITHFTIRKERGIPDTKAVIDDLAPVYHVRADAPPMLLVTGDRNLELLGRYEENAYLWRMMNLVKHPDTKLLELQGYDHGGMAGPGFPLLLAFVKRIAQ